MKKALLLLAVVHGLVACDQQNQSVDKQAEGELLMQLSRDWSDRVQTGNIDSIMIGWADDAVMMVPGFPPLRGKEEIRRYVEQGLELPGFKVRWQPLEVHVSDCGDMAYMIERNEMILSDSLGDPLVTYNKTVTVWRKRQDGQWENVVDMWNEDPEGRL